MRNNQTTEERRAAQPTYRGPRRWMTLRVDPSIYDKIETARAIRGDTLIDWCCAALDTMACAEIERAAERREKRRSKPAIVAVSSPAQTELEDAIDNASAGRRATGANSRADRGRKK